MNNINILIPFLLLLSSMAQAEAALSTETNKYPLSTPKVQKKHTMLDCVHYPVSKGVIDIAKRLDSFFRDERVEEEVKQSRVKLRTSIEFSEYESTGFKHSLNVKLTLPQLRNKWQLFIDNLPDELERNTINLDDTETAAGLQYRLSEKLEWLTLNGGIKVKSRPVPFLKLRSKKSFDFDPWAIHGTQFLFWFEDDGFGETSRLDLERRLNHILFFRAVSQATWPEISHGIEWEQIFSLFHRLHQRQALGLTLFAQGPTEPSTVVEEYSATVRYRFSVYRDWLFFEIAPEINFSRENNYKLNPTIHFAVETIFGEYE